MDVGVMRYTKLIILLVIASFISSCLIFKNVKADETIDNIVDATFNISLVSATDFDVDVAMDVSRIKVFENIYDRGDIQILASSTNVDDIENMGAIKFSLRQLLDKQISGSFEGANYTATTSKPSYESGLFKIQYAINLTSLYFGLSSNVNAYNLVNGALDMGAISNYSFNLKTEPGWNNTFIFNLGQTYTFKRTNGVLSGANILWIIKNWNGNAQNTTAEIQLKKVSPTTIAESENIFLEFYLNSKNPGSTSLVSNVLLKNIDIRTYNILPYFIYNLDFMPADGIRLFVNNGLLTWDVTYEKTVKPLQQKIKSNIEESVLNQTIDFIFIWDNGSTIDCTTPFDVSKMNEKPEIRSILTDDSIFLKICNISSRAFLGLINSGADSTISKEDINFGNNLKDLDYDYNVTLFLPEKLYLDGKNIYTWNETKPLSGKFKSDNVQNVYTGENKDIVIEIEIKTSDLNILSFLTGKTELTFGVDFKAKSNYNVTDVSQQFVLPNKVTLKYLNSDAFRLCVEENIFDTLSVDSFLRNGKTDFENRLKKLLPALEVSASIKKDVFQKSLIWDSDISKMDAETPVKTSLFAHSSYPVGVSFSILPPKFEIPTRVFNFSGIPNQDVTYKIMFPQGISIDVFDHTNKTKKKGLSDGRQYFEISFSASESDLSVDVSCKMTPSALFIIGVFIPCIITVIIIIVLIIVIFIIRKKRKGKRFKGAPEEVPEEEIVTGYDGEEYYVPPPPNSK